MEQLLPDTPYSELAFNTTLEVNDLNQLRQKLQQNIGFINTNKQRIRHQEYTQLMNYHQYALNVLNNMVNIKEVEYSNPYNQNIRDFVYGQRKNPYETAIVDARPKVAYYNRDGVMKVVDPLKFKQREEWERQFDQNLINPPCYVVPPTSCFRPQTSNNQ